MTRRARILAALLLAPCAVAQAPDVDAAIARFAALDFRHKAAVVRAVQRQLAQSGDAALQRIAALRVETADLPDAPAMPPTYDPAAFAKEEHAAGRAPARRIVPVDDPAHVAVTQRFLRPAFLPDLRAEVVYDWATGAVVRAAPLGYDELFTNAAHGWAPGSDHAVARLLHALDRDPLERKLGAWFAHTYCDLDARAFPPVTLYDAWYSGRVVDVPDVDAIPFAWQVLAQKSYRSPLSGAPRDRLYEEIRRAALRHRIHRTECEAAAAAFVRDEPVMDPTYALLVPRFHYLWATLGDDVDALARKLAAIDRDAMIEQVDAAIRDPGGAAFEVREGRKAELGAMRGLVTAIALRALEQFGQ